MVNFGNGGGMTSHRSEVERTRGGVYRKEEATIVTGKIKFRTRESTKCMPCGGRRSEWGMKAVKQKQERQAWQGGKSTRWRW